MEKIKTTYSMWNKFRSCPKSCQFRYLENLVPLKKDSNLTFGSVIHECLECWHGDYNVGMVYKILDEMYPERATNENQKYTYRYARAMMTGYFQAYVSDKDSFEVVCLEKEFQGEIINPKTGSFSRSFSFAGKVDGVVKVAGEHYLLEHKTASTIDSTYIERLWNDFQITLYSWYMREVYKYPIVGIIYNILGKAKLKQGEGETEAEYETRRQELIAKSKSGKTTAKRKMPETDEEYHERLQKKCSDPKMFHREIIYISQDRYADLRQELWELSQTFLFARRRKFFCKNTSSCYQYRRQCAYHPICTAKDPQMAIDNFFEKVEPHQELSVGKSEDETVAELSF